MKSRSSKLVRFASVLGLALWTVGPRAAAQVVEIPDAGLRDAIRAALGKPAGDIAVADLESLTTLDASRRARGADAPLIGSLEGLQTAQNLTQLDLSGHAWSSPMPSLGTGDLSILAGLAHLNTLDLNGNRLTDLTLPAGLTSLDMLNLECNQLANLTLTSGLSSLTHLGLADIHVYPLRTARLVLRACQQRFLRVDRVGCSHEPR